MSSNNNNNSDNKIKTVQPQTPSQMQKDDAGEPKKTLHTPQTEAQKAEALRTGNQSNRSDAPDGNEMMDRRPDANRTDGRPKGVESPDYARADRGNSQSRQPENRT